MWGGWLTAAFSSCWIHQCVCFSWLHVIFLFPGVSGVTVVTQKPPVVTQSKGETATMDCNLGTVTNYGAWWYKQIPGGVPQYVLYFIHSWSSPSYGSGFSSPKFTSTHQSLTDYRLIINNVEEGDSAVYYCSTWDSSANEWVSQWFTLWQKPPHSHINFNAPSNVPLPCTSVLGAHSCVCVSKFVKCKFSFTEALIKDPSVSPRYHPANVSLYITAQAPQGDARLSPVVHISHLPFILSVPTCRAETCLESCHTCTTISPLKVVKLQMHITIGVIEILPVISYLYMILTQNCTDWEKKNIRLA